MKFKDKKIEKYTPIKVKVSEYLEYGTDASFQEYECLTIEYITVCYKVGKESYDIIIPEHPEKNIDNFWENGIAFVNASRNGDLYVVGNGSPGSRWLKLKKWKELDF